MKQTEGKKKKKKQKQKKPRIALISTHGYVAADPPLGAPDTGGQVVFVLELAKKLSQFGFKVDVLTRRFEKQPEKEDIAKGVRLIRIPCGSKDFVPKEYLHEYIPEWVRRTLEYIRSNSLEYIFINSHYWDAGIAGDSLASRLGIPHVHTPHSLGAWKKEQMETDYPDSKEHFEEKYNFSCRIRNETNIYRNADLVIATTPIQVDKLEDEYSVPKGKIQMIPPGYDDNRFFPVGEPSRQAAREMLDFSGEVIFAVSRLASNKGLDLLIDAFAVTAERRENAKLVLAIGHEDRSESEEAIYQNLLELRSKHGLEDRVSFRGFIPDEELADYYRASDLFVLSSRYEPFGMTIIEAMASGTPTVVTVHGGLYRVLDYGVHTLFADPFDREDLGITMVKALRYRSLRRRLAKAGAELARSRFTWTGIAQQMLNALESRQNDAQTLQVKPRDD
ncbi:MAG: glycosyltransferase [Spirochaetales bacterium]|nr:glycosyltransferase [Spirochaetales bacterium]MCF7939727.1 glycosyltransferase [Spirochaetales bacterium]